MMKKWFSIFVLLALTAQCFSQLGIVASFELHRDYIAKVLCINRDKPEMHCNGKCYLAKQLKEQQQNEHSGNVVVQVDLALFCSTAQDFALPITPSGHTPYGKEAFPVYTRPFSAIFHPPTA